MTEQKIELKMIRMSEVCLLYTSRKDFWRRCGHRLCTTKTKLRKVLEFCDTDITARTLGETHVSTYDLT